MNESSQKSALRTLLEVAVLWVAANAGYFIIFPSFGVSLSYNEAPLVFTVYFLFWFSVALYALEDTLARLLPDKRLWTYAASCTAFGAIVAYLLSQFSPVPGIAPYALPPYTDILFATPWYFLPKSAEVFLQQTLIASIILALYRQYKSLNKTIGAYALAFGSAHALMYLITGAPAPYATIMTLAAVASAAVFPYLIVRVRNGFLYAFFAHMLFYVLLALVLQAWPPPGHGF